MWRPNRAALGPEPEETGWHGPSDVRQAAESREKEVVTCGEQEVGFKRTLIKVDTGALLLSSFIYAVLCGLYFC